jgi:choline dehydrogenase
VAGGGWDFADVLPAFVDVEWDLEHDHDPWHGGAGPIRVTRYPRVEPTEFETAVRAALNDSGLVEVPDLNRPGVTGFGRMPMNSVGGRRSITVDVLDAAPASLELLADSVVAAVLFDGRRVTGVRLSDGSILDAGTVVLAGGVVGSPCVLMRSGIGPADLLTALGIEVRLDLPGVGENLCDHPAVSIDTGYRGVQRDGPILHTLATFRSPFEDASGAAPDLALWTSDPEGEPAEGWFDVLLWRPRARGRVQIASADPSDNPRIWLPQPTDGDVAILDHGVRQALRLLETTPLRSVGATRPHDVPQGADALRAWVGAESYSLPHTVGTCAVGMSPKHGAVVDATGGSTAWTAFTLPTPRSSPLRQQVSPI